MNEKFIVMKNDMSKEIPFRQSDLLVLPRIGETLLHVELGYFKVTNITHVPQNNFDKPYITIEVEEN